MKQIQPKQWILATAGLASTAVALSALDCRLLVRRYSLTTAKVTQPVNLAVLSDLHNSFYGKGQKTLLQTIQQERPDGILLVGDILDDRHRRRKVSRTFDLLVGLQDMGYPVYYVTGNHERMLPQLAEYKKWMKRLGVTVLEGQQVILETRGQQIAIAGLEDPKVGETVWQRQLEYLGRHLDPSVYTVLMSHRPERVSHYEQYPFDLVVSGHAHGGQWRVPGLVNGVYAPMQGLFPSYAGGLYPLKTGHLIVSRGLARGSAPVPRIWNRPELVMVEVKPPNSQG